MPFRSFSTCLLDSVIFSNEVGIIEENAFHNINYVEFSKTPQYVSKDFVKLGCETIVIPKGGTSEFIKFGFSPDKLIEGGPKVKFNITVEKPGTILSSLPLNKLNEIDSLTITGFLYETDLEIIRKCKILRYLDLSHTYITYSPEIRKQHKSDMEALNFLFGLVGEGLDNKYRDGTISTNEYKANKALTYVLQSSTEFKESEENCLIPQIGRASCRERVCQYV